MKKRIVLYSPRTTGEDDMPKLQGEFITVKEASERSKYHQEYIRLLLKLGKVQGVKFSGAWLVDAQSLQDYVNEMLSSDDGRAGPKQ